MTIRVAPAFRRKEDNDMIPKGLLVAMLGLVLSAVTITSYAVLSDRPHVGVPSASTPVRERMLILEGHSAQAVTVRAADGSVLVDLPHGGFVTVIQSAVFTARRRHGVDQTLPVRLVEYANGRLVMEDPETDYSFELYAFGGDNKAAFERLFDQ
jgi:putative photosynthetic complex assembly protein